MPKRAYRWKWTAAIDRHSLESLQKLAVDLGFIVDVPGGNLGKPSPAGLLDSLATAYQHDPAEVTAALKQLGVTSASKPG